MNRRPQSPSLADGETLREFVRHVRVGMYITTPEGAFLDANPALLEILGVESIDALKARRVDEFLTDPAQRPRVLEVVDRDGHAQEVELEIRRADGTVRTVLDSSYAAGDPRTGEIRYYGVLVDITERKRAADDLVQQSLRDPLTGCYNRRYLSTLERRASARPGESWGCIIIDIDHFKQFNDRFGHQAGDRALVKMARFLMRHVRAEDAVVRLGGDEFVIMLADADGERVQQVVGRLQRSALRSAPVEFSLGWAVRYPRENLTKVLGRADKNLLAVRVMARSGGEQRRGEAS
ncbi:MAG TPA: sensor domain-containing diguanylate cyclase [Gemmatimonadaceae bacterium]|jgi:diguanylate cyclase (GGDEF)-like protein/PAS domain S-box-containing protein